MNVNILTLTLSITVWREKIEARVTATNIGNVCLLATRKRGDENKLSRACQAGVGDESSFYNE